jgi:hypothetical protein
MAHPHPPPPHPPPPPPTHIHTYILTAMPSVPAMPTWAVSTPRYSISASLLPPASFPAAAAAAAAAGGCACGGVSRRAPMLAASCSSLSWPMTDTAPAAAARACNTSRSTSHHWYFSLGANFCSFKVSCCCLLKSNCLQSQSGCIGGCTGCIGGSLQGAASHHDKAC